MRLLAALSDVYDPDRRLGDLVAAELGAEGWEVVRARAVEPGSLAGADAALVLMLPVAAAAIEGATGLRVIQAASRGYDAVDVAAAGRHGVPVCNVQTPGHAETVAEHTFALLLAVAKRVPEGHAGIVAGRWPAPELVAAGLTELTGKTLGLVGLGEIGRQVARRAVAFGMGVLYTDERAAPGLEQELGLRRTTLGELLDAADVVSLHVPLTARTAGLVGASELARLKPGAILINTSRGPVVDLDALDAALRAGRIRAGLDVFDPEPPAGHPVLSAPNLVCSPHIGGVTAEMLERVLRDALANLRRLARGEPLLHVVNGVAP